MFSNRYRAAAENLLGPLSRQCGFSEESLERADAAFGFRLPLALRDYYLAIGNLPELNDAHDQLFGPSNWFLNDGKLVFMVENQAVLYWGVEATTQPEPDPQVFQGINNEPEPIEWHVQHECCSEFLLVMLHWQAVMGGLEWAGMADVSDAIIASFDKQWQRVGQIEGLIAFCQKEQAACFIGDGQAQQLYVSARSEERFANLTAELQQLGVKLMRL